MLQTGKFTSLILPLSNLLGFSSMRLQGHDLQAAALRFIWVQTASANPPAATQCFSLLPTLCGLYVDHG